MAENYNHKNIEKKWQDKWQSDGIYNVSDKAEGKDKFYQLVEFSYPSGNLHVGHWYAFSVPDIFARYKRMQGFNVLYPMGFDAFGLPAENAAIKLGADPKVWTYEQMEKMRTQLRTMGASFPWDREVVTCDPEYYKWTQWMFNQFLKNDLVYRAITKVNWCSKDQTILANEQVTDGKCERCGTEVVQRDQPQWMLRITKYADRLIDDLDALDWPSAIKESQKNWIGRSEGSVITFALTQNNAELTQKNAEKIEVFTTRADTLFGVTYIVLAPEHPLVESLKPRAGDNVVIESFKFRPELVELIKKREKNVTFRMEAKNVSIGDTVSLVDWADGNSENQTEFLQAKITKISEFKLIDLPLDYPGHEKDSSIEERLVRYQEYYGKNITNDSTVYVYEFAPIYSKILNFDEVEKYIADTKKKSELDRQQSKEKTGVELKGIKAINPANGEEVPVWIADYVLSGYGTGAVMAVPAHDERDFEFANKYNLPIKQVVSPENILKSIAVSPTLKDSEKFKQQLKDANISFEIATSAISGREHIRVNFSKDKLEVFISLVQTQIIGTNWVEVLGAENIVIQKDDVQYGLLDNSQSWFEKFSQWEPFVREQKNLWDMLGKNPFLREFVCYVDYGILRNSDKFNGLTSEEARQKITEFVGGKIVKTYRLRDWGISRQRYWGCPIPIVYDPEGNAHPVPDEHLPWILPTDVDHTPDGTAPLARSKELFERTEKIFGAGWRPEVETMDTFVDSSWYFYRYLDNKNDKEFSSMDKMDAWMPIDLYMGGAEHTTMHLLYSRFWTKALYDLGFVKDNEAYKVRRNRGLILGPDGEKMSKSRGNVINPDEIVERLGADTVRLYLAFMGPYGNTANYPWDPNGVVGVRRFIERVWKLKEKIDKDKKVCRTDSLVHKTIKGVKEDIEEFKFNTAISKMMILLNALEKEEKVVFGSYKILLKLLAPFAPHITEELWQEIGESGSIHLAEWPKHDESLIKDEVKTIGIQINGKVRDEIDVTDEDTEESLRDIVLSREKVKSWVGDSEVKKFIYIKGRLVSIVV